MIGAGRLHTLSVLVAVLTGAGAIAAWWLPARTDVPAGASVVPSAPVRAAPPTVATQADPADVDAIVNQNIFSATRSAPATRWSPPGLETAPPPADMTVLDTAATQSPSGDPMLADEVPALYGTAVGDSAPRALLRLSASDAAPRLYRVGERHGGWRVVSITAQRVVLASSAGTRTLRLPAPGTER